MARYHVLIMKDDDTTSPWGVAFGDYDKETVEAELDDYLDHGWKRRELRIITTTTDKQADIDAEVAKLNA